MTAEASLSLSRLPPLLPRNKLRRGPLVNLPLDNLRTGSSLFCVGWRNGGSWLLTSVQYTNLVENLPVVGLESGKPDELESGIPPELESGKPDELESDNPKYDKFFSYLSHNRPDTLSDQVWMFSDAEPPDPAYVWSVVPLGTLVEPPPPQPAPEPFAGADRYTTIGPEWRDESFIPSLKRKTAAKKEKNLAKLVAEKKHLCAERKMQFKEWGKVLRGVLGSHTNSHNSAQCNNENCTCCGASFFKTVKRVCLDCGFSFGELRYQPRKIDGTDCRDAVGLLPVQDVTKGSNRRWRRRLTPKQFVAGLVLRGRLKDYDPVSLEKAMGSYQILCERWLPRDVAAFSLDSVRAIKGRADRLHDTITKHEASGEPLPEPNDNEKNNLHRYLSTCVLKFY